MEKFTSENGTKVTINWDNVTFIVHDTGHMSGGDLGKDLKRKVDTIYFICGNSISVSSEELTRSPNCGTR